MMHLLPLTLFMAVSATYSSCPHGGASLGSAVRAFYLTSGVHDDTQALEEETKDITEGWRWTETTQRTCGAHLSCDASQKYRSFDGTCNNLRKPATGSRGQCYRRILPASYVDGISKPPKRVPIANIFNALQSRPELPPPPYTTMFTTFTQFVVHDIMETAMSPLNNSFDCCAPETNKLPKCAMRIDTEEAMGYRNHGIKCMSFVRAARCPCSNGRTRESMNLQTAYLDLSHVYLDGSSRLPGTPFLRKSFSQHSGDLPHLDPEPPICYADDGICFEGDARMNQQQGISMHHIVFERQHNLIAGKLTKLNPSWDSETVFQEARKILIARWQYIYCKELLPISFDDQLSRDARIHIDQLMEGTEVDPNAETIILAESVHSESRAHYMVTDSIGDHELIWLDSDKYFTDKEFLINLLRGQLYEPLNPLFPMKSKVAQEVLKKSNDPLGLSMMMINIQRGRDTGLSSFRDQVAWAFNTTVDSFNDLAKLNIFEEEDLKLLRRLYPTIEEIDPWVGGHLQKSAPGSGIGAYVHQKIRAIQHYGHIYGDRFFFSHRDVFSEKQRDAISKSTSYSQMLCEVIDLDKVPLNPFKHSENVSEKPCASFVQLDLEPWKV